MENELKYRAKIMAIRRSVHTSKDMKVSLGGKGSYAARSEEGTLNALQPLLDKYQIDVVCTKVVAVDTSPTHFKAIYTYNFIDCETGYTETVEYAGSGTDRSDKDTGKAGTYAFKNMLIKRFFMVSGEDSDNVSSDVQHNSIHSELTSKFKRLVTAGYFNSTKMNPSQDQRGHDRAMNECSNDIKEHIDDTSWLMWKDREFSKLLERVK